MEKLSIRSDGVTEMPSGLQAVAMFYRLKDNGVQAQFSFKASVLSDSIVVRWPSDSDVAIVPPETGAALVTHAYARYLFDDEVEQYNVLVDGMLSGSETPVDSDPAISKSSVVESQVESPAETLAPASSDSVPPGTAPAMTPDSPASGVPGAEVPPVAPTGETAPVAPPAPPVAAPVPPVPAPLSSPVTAPPAEPTGKGKAK